MCKLSSDQDCSRAMLTIQLQVLECPISDQNSSNPPIDWRKVSSPNLPRPEYISRYATSATGKQSREAGCLSMGVRKVHRTDPL